METTLIAKGLARKKVLKLRTRFPSEPPLTVFGGESSRMTSCLWPDPNRFYY